ncbi:hypothetical protein EOL94_03140 [bacterium]|nr:hypothetical protein [bacterium]
MSLKIDLLGEVGKLKFKKDGEINLPHLIKPLEWEDAVCRVVCNQCKIIQEVNLDYAISIIEILQVMGVPLPKDFKEKEDFKGWYFLVPYCNCCNENNNIQQLSIKEVPRLN